MSSKDIVVKLRLEKSGMVKGLADIEGGFNLVYGAAARLGTVLNEAMDRGFAYGNLLKRNTLDISQARKATKGLVDDMTLLKAANTAVEFRMGLTAKQFAVFSKAAVVQSQKLGIDANKALDDLLTGTARGSRMILDNLGFIVKQGASVADVVSEINLKVGEQQVFAENAGAEWAKFKIEFKNAWDGVSNSLSESGIIKDTLGWFVEKFRDLGEAMQFISKVAQEMDIADFGDRRNMSRRSQLNLSAAGRAQLEADRERLKDLGGQDITASTLNISAKKGRGGRRGGRRKSNDFTAPSFSSTVEDAERAEAWIRQQEILPVLNDLLREQDTRAAAAAIAQGNLAQKSQIASNAMRLQMETTKNLNTVQTQWAQDTRDMALGSVLDLTTGFVSSVDTMIQTGASFKEVMLNMLKQTAFSIMGQAAAHAVKMAGVAIEYGALAANPLGGQAWYPAVASAWASVAKWSAIAGGAGLAGIGLSLATAGGGKSGGGTSAGGSRRDKTRRPSFGARTSRSDKPQPVHVNVYLGDKNNPSAMLLAKEQATAAVRGRLAS